MLVHAVLLWATDVEGTCANAHKILSVQHSPGVDLLERKLKNVSHNRAVRTGAHTFSRRVKHNTAPLTAGIVEGPYVKANTSYTTAQR